MKSVRKARKRKAPQPQAETEYAVLGEPSRYADAMAEDRGYDEAQPGRYMTPSEQSILAADITHRVNAGHVGWRDRIIF